MLKGNKQVFLILTKNCNEVTKNTKILKRLQVGKFLIFTIYLKCKMRYIISLQHDLLV